MIIGLSVLVLLVGVLVYALSANPRNQELGRIMFFCGLLVFLLKAAEGGLNAIVK